MVSKRPDAVCLHCGNVLDICDINYVEYINMTEKNVMNSGKIIKKG